MRAALSVYGCRQGGLVCWLHVVIAEEGTRVGEGLPTEQRQVIFCLTCADMQAAFVDQLRATQAPASRERCVSGIVPHSAAHKQLKALVRLRRASAATRDMALAFQYKCLLEEWQAYLQGEVSRPPLLAGQARKEVALTLEALVALQGHPCTSSALGAAILCFFVHAIIVVVID